MIILYESFYFENRHIAPNAIEAIADAPTRTQGGRNIVKRTPTLNAESATVAASHNLLQVFI
jgi:hypothetical protein